MPKSKGKREVATKAVMLSEAEEPCNQGQADGEMECGIMKIPETIMLHILGFLSVKDLCKTACVCRRWNHVVRQKPVWRHVDLSPFKINLVNIRKLVFAYFSDSLRTLRLRGFLRSIKNTECISDALLTQLGKRCPNLKELCIIEANLACISSSSLPPGLSTLKLLKCNYPTFWLSEASKQAKLDSLRHLDLSGSTGFGVRDVECLTPKPLSSLLTLRLEGCYRVGHQGASRIAHACPGLQELYLMSSYLSDQALQDIGMGLSQLKVLKLCQNESTSPGNVHVDLHHFNSLKRLEELHLANDKDFTKEDVMKLAKSLPSLRLLRLYKKTDDIAVDRLGRISIIPHGNKDMEICDWKVEISPDGRKEVTRTITWP